ncbi:BAF_collapsed_G0025560.mRNA.1.CDS.1 [Saccharomyces cerevisiae]|nr:Pth1p [Saccharomyces cerevisiae YJM1439]AJU30561.1 Pth1p [Saccharomyces cerevisiae YJM627]AJV29431.1 Pth1p [Saccharomyces cerevisiae YJM1248]CAD6470172.1 Y55_G0057110.mRNA.1.CDS.1 [Saccharomyces cerevisiae]CAI4516450.1 CFA_G0025130.mRNA.1.CDS.1 [Saccharomyces cerevisiae]
MSGKWRLVLTGIGNPEPQYAGTRHNVGLYMLELLRKRLGLQGRTYSPVPNTGGKVHYIEDEHCTILRSDGQYMNLSGEQVCKVWARYAKYQARHVVIHDELSVACGKVQLRAPSTSIRGHNGLRSLQKCSGGRVPFAKLAIGIGREPGSRSRDPASVSRWVLGALTPQELQTLLTQSEPAAWRALTQYIS